MPFLSLPLPPCALLPSSKTLYISLLRVLSEMSRSQHSVCKVGIVTENLDLYARMITLIVISHLIVRCQ